jgi:bifunctional non-homologous end joining protein LigD
MAQETRPVEATGPREMLASLRPQIYAKGSPNKVVEPIVEPLWVGVRTLAAVDDAGAAMVDAEGLPIPDVEPLLRGLADATHAETLLVDGYITKQGGRSGSVYLWSDDLPSTATLFGLRRNRAVDTVKLKEGALDAVTFEPGDEVRLVVTDLLWVDGASLFDVPLLERRRLLESAIVESDLVRLGAYVRPPIHTWVGSWKAQGFEGLTFKAANSRYRPGESSPEWVVSGMPRR